MIYIIIAGIVGAIAILGASKILII